jgi:hypothetical protein
MRVLFWCLMTAAALCMPTTEFLRSVIHKRRERAQGIGGTQDIAITGTLVFVALTIATIVVAITGNLFPRR